MTVLLITATALEQQRLVDVLCAPVPQAVVGRRWTRGLYHQRDVQLVETGLGAVNTAHALTRSLEMAQPEWVLQIGVGGAYLGTGLGVGDLAVATEENYGDLGVLTPDGWRPADEIGIPVAEVDGERHFNRFSLDAARSRRAVEVLAGAELGRVAGGPFVTVQACSGSNASGHERQRRVPGAICESMEGAAAAHVCALYGVPLVEVRGISNLVEDRDLSRWDLPLACGRAQDAGLRLLEAL